MRMYTIYDHPADHPEQFVVREWINSSGVVAPGEIILKGSDIEKIRKTLRGCGLVPTGRAPNDDPKILESWL